MLKITHTTSFKKLKKQNKDLSPIGELIQKISSELPLEIKYRDHTLVGNYKGKRECHIKPNWLLIYEINEKEKKLVLHRTGTHSELLKK